MSISGTYSPDYKRVGHTLLILKEVDKKENSFTGGRKIVPKMFYLAVTILHIHLPIWTFQIYIFFYFFFSVSLKNIYMERPVWITPGYSIHSSLNIICIVLI